MRGLAEPGPYFIDADSIPNAGGWPRGGLTVVKFQNSHLAYALTWFGLAGTALLFGAWPTIEALRARRAHRGAFAANSDGVRS